MYTGHMRDGASYNVYKRLPHHTIFSLPLAHPRDTPLFFPLNFSHRLSLATYYPESKRTGGDLHVRGNSTRLALMVMYHSPIHTNAATAIEVRS